MNLIERNIIALILVFTTHRERVSRVITCEICIRDIRKSA